MTLDHKNCPKTLTLYSRHVFEHFSAGAIAQISKEIKKSSHKRLSITANGDHKKGAIDYGKELVASCVLRVSDDKKKQVKRESKKNKTLKLSIVPCRQHRVRTRYNPTVASM